MEQFVILINLLKEFTESVYPDYDRETVMIEVPQKYYQDLLLKIEKLDVLIAYKYVKKDHYVLVIGYLESFETED